MEKTIAIRIDEDLHKKIKIRLAENGATLKDYIISLVKNDLDGNVPTKWAKIPADSSVNEQTVKEAQRVLDFVSEILRSQDGKDMHD